MPAYQPPKISFTLSAPGLFQGNPSYDDVEITASDFPAAYQIGWHDVWCADRQTVLYTSAPYNIYTGATIYSSYEYNILRTNPDFATVGNNPGNTTSVSALTGTTNQLLNTVPVDSLHPVQPYLENLDIVNWLLNNSQVSPTTYSDTINGTIYSNIHYYTVTGVAGLFTFGDIEQTIYQLLGDGWSGNAFLGISNPTDVTTLVNALVSGSHEGYMPDVGEKIAVLLDSGSNPYIPGAAYQPLIMQTDAAKLGDYVWEDSNANGIQDDGDTGINGATVILWRDLDGNGHFDGGNELLATTTTITKDGKAGYYEFKGLTPGLDYQVEFVKPAGYDAVSPRQVAGSTAANDSDGLDSDHIVLAPGDFNQTIDSGFYKLAKLSGYVYQDVGNDGVRNSEPPIAGVTITLTGTDGLGNAVTATATTDGNGYYHFDNLVPGTYTVSETQPIAYLDGKDTAGSAGGDTSVNDVISNIVLKSGTDSTENNFGEILPASLGDRLWNDTNVNGLQDAGEAGISGQTVTLIGGGADGVIGTGGDDTTATTTTGADGIYQFTGLTPGVQYQVQFTAPAGALYTYRDVGNDDTIDSDADTVTGMTQIVTLAQGENNTTLDAGVYKAGIDIEKLVHGEYQTGGTGGTEGLTPGFWKTHTGSGGAQLSGWPETGYTPGQSWEAIFGRDVLGTATPTLLDALSSNGGGVNALLRQATAGLLNAANPNVDYKYTVAQVISMTDAALDSGNATTIENTKNLFAAQNELGADLSTPAPSPTLVVTPDVDADTSGSGPQIPVGGTAVFTYLVTNTGTAEVSNVVVTDSRLTNVTFVGGDTDHDGKLDVNETWRYTASETVTSSAEICNIGTVTGNVGPTPVTDSDKAFYNGSAQTQSLGDFVWMDTNFNGKQDAGEAGIAGLTVTLTGGGADGLINGVGDTTATTTTDADGFYQFTGLAAGTQYQVTFTKPTGTVFTLRDQGADDTIDSDADQTTGKSQIVTLHAGENNPTIDAGVYLTGDLSITKTDGLTTVCPGQKITYTIVASNSGPSDAVNALIKDVMPANLTNVTWTSVAAGGASGNDLTGIGNINDYVNLKAGSSITYTVTGTVATSALPPTTADFGTGTNNTGLGQNVTINGIRADAFYNGYQTTNTQLWERNVTDDHGLGVSSNGEPNPATSGGDVNELSNQLNNEVIRLTKANATDKWTELWVSSLDSGGSGGAEKGTLYWSNSATPDLSTLTSKFTFKYGDFGPDTAEGNVLALNPAGFDATAKYVFFVAGPNAGGTNNDYLVWKASTVATSCTLVNTATVSGPDGFKDTNSANNSATDSDALACKAHLGDFVWEDKNANGLQDDGELGIGGVTVNLRDSGGTVIASTTTDASGHYGFDVAPGTYSVAVVAPAGYVVTTKDVGGNGNDTMDSDIATSGTLATGNVTLAAGQSNLTLDAGFYKTASIGDRVWLDCDRDGVQDNGEVGVANVTVTLIGGGADGLINGIGDTIVTTTTNANGAYAFTRLTPGTQYQVQFTPLSGYSFTTKDAGGNDATDSDADLVTGKTPIVTLSSGENNTTLDAGLTPDCRPVTFCLTGNSALDGPDGNSRTFTDALTGVSVTARAFSQDKLADNTPTNNWQAAWLGAYSGGLGVTDSSEGDGSGNAHTVDNVGRNNYIVLQFSQDVTVDKAYLGYVVGDSDVQIWIGNSATPITTMSNSVLASMNYSEVNTTTLTSARWADVNAGGAHGNVLIIAADTTDTTPEDYFKVQQVAVCAPDYCTPVAKASIGDFVWEDKNYNGVQDAGEAGISGVTVNLLNSAGTVLATTTTDASGHYLFSNLNPADYKVQVIAPSGYFVTKQDQGGNDATDSDISGTGTSSGTTILTTLSAGENDLSWDAGLYRKACVGDKVWEDWNHNNVQDVGEGGIGGIRISLMDATGTTVLATTTTDANGNYSFGNLNPGTYVLQFDKGNVIFNNSHWGGSYNMSTWKWAVKDTGSNDAIDSDVAGNAIATTDVSKTDAFTLVSGQNDLTRDAGITPIVIDLNGDGIHSVSRQDSQGTFDLFGNGQPIHSGWLSGDDGFLAVDKNGNGKIDSIDELFGGTAKGAGFAQVSSYDSNHDGVVDSRDAGFAELKIWHDANGNHQTDDGELMTLAQAGITSLNVSYTNLPFLDAQGNVHLERSTATASDGHSLDMTDLYFSVSAEDAAASGVTLPSMAELLQDTAPTHAVVDVSSAHCAVAANDASCTHAPLADLGWLFG